MLAERQLQIIIGGLVIVNVLAWIAVFEAAQPDLFEVRFFDVGQGDSILIETPQHHQILIDGGPNRKSVIRKLSAAMPFWDRTIDMVVLTHPHQDHAAGLIEVLRRYRVDAIMWTGVSYNSYTYDQLRERVEREQGIDVYRAREGMNVRAGKARIRVLYPFDVVEYTEPNDANDTSVVLQASFGDTQVMLPGDITEKIEHRLVKQSTIQADILKVPHQGSRTSSSERFLQAVSPAISVISVGHNSYGHPHKEVMDRIQEHSKRMLRTDRVGDIILHTRGSEASIIVNNIH